MFTSSRVASLFRGDDRHWPKTLVSVGLMLALKSTMKKNKTDKRSKDLFLYDCYSFYTLCHPNGIDDGLLENTRS